MAIEGDFYEDDEPLEKILDLWERLPKGVTEPPAERSRGVTGFIRLDEAIALHDMFVNVTTGFATVYKPVLEEPLSA